MLQEKQNILDKIDLLISSLVNLEDKTGKYTLIMSDGTAVDQISFDFWEWTSGIGLYGMMKYYRLTRKQSILNQIKEWFDAHLPDREAEKNINTMVQMLTLAYLYEETEEEKYRPYLQTWAEWLYKELPRTRCGAFEHMTFGPRNYEQIWDDTLMMSGVTLVKLGLLLNKPEYVEEVKYQFLVHAHYLADRVSGLWYHAWHCRERHNFANALWGRGNSWITIAIPEYLDLVKPSEHEAVSRFLKMILKSQIEGLEQYQDASGMWHTLIDHPESYLEASATAGFSYGVLKAVHSGIVDERYKKMGINGVRAVIRCINPDGSLAQTSIGTGAAMGLEEYLTKEIAPVPFGQSMAILSLCEYLKGLA